MSVVVIVMGKKIISIVLIITVNVFLLTSAVVPHHHHDGIPHFALSEHPQHHHESHEDSSDCCSCPADENSCAFDQEIDAVSQTREECSCVLCHLHHHSDFLVQAVLLFYTYNLSLTKEDLYSQLPPPYLINYHFDYASSGLGLRAPPVL